MNVFDIIGPVMIGPSSSHTAGAARIGHIARQLLQEEPAAAQIVLYGSFAKTYKGHGTDKALIAGQIAERFHRANSAACNGKHSAYLLYFFVGTQRPENRR